MKKFLLLGCFITTFTFIGQTPCDSSGMSGDYPCNGYELLSNMPLSTFDAQTSNDSWGWTDPQDGKEYVLMGLNNGTAFIDITDPINPVYLGKLPSNGQDSFRGNWRDIKVYNNYAFIVSEINGHGMQVFDLTKLRNVTSPPATFSDDGVYTGFGRAHNVVINEAQGYAYGVGTTTFNGGAHFVNIQDPTNPVAAGGWADDQYTHDAQVVTYIGPDADYQGQEIYVGSNADEVVFVDVTDKDNPSGISTIGYGNIGYTHQGWFTEDQKYFIVTDELDEVFFGNNIRLLVLDVTDLDFPTLHMEYIGPTTASDHNAYVKGDKVYLSAYRGGMRVIDISDIDNMNMEEIGYFDTWPADDIASASIGDPGAWNVYPFFDSGSIVITNFSDGGGLFIVRDQLLSVDDVAVNTFKVFPNPAADIFTVSSENEAIQSIALYDITGKQLLLEADVNAQNKELDISHLSQGLYMVSVNGNSATKLLKQ